MPFKPPFWSPAQASGILFDWDGVIAETHLDFSGIRARYYAGRRAMLLEDASALSDADRASLMSDLEALEIAGANGASQVPGIDGVLEWVAARGIPWAVVSRNCRESILTAAEQIGLTLPPIVRSRDDGDCVKPDPRALNETAHSLGVEPRHTLFVGDFIYDMMGARRAGMRGVLVRERTEEGWLPWLECSLTNMEGFLRELRSPSEFVPWEYHDAAEAMGRGFLAFAASLVIAMPQRTFRGMDRWLARAASLGVGGFLAPNEIFSPVDWKANPAFDPSCMGKSLASAAREFLRVRFPLAEVYDDAEAVSGAPAAAEELENFLWSLYKRHDISI